MKVPVLEVFGSVGGVAALAVLAVLVVLAVVITLLLNSVSSGICSKGRAPSLVTAAQQSLPSYRTQL